MQKCDAEVEAARTREAHDALIAELKDNVRERIDAQKETERLKVELSQGRVDSNQIFLNHLTEVLNLDFYLS